MRKGIFITATGTEIGKTYVSAHMLKQLISLGYHAGYYKAAASDAVYEHGRWVAEDQLEVMRIAGIKEKDCKISYIYHHSLSPHLAAKLENNPIEFKQIQQDLRLFEETHDFVIIEGSGGILCPLRDDQQTLYLSDVMRMSQYPLLIVASAGLGTINASVLSIHYAKQLHLPVLGFILNHYEKENAMHLDNLAMIEKLSGVPVLGCIENNEEFVFNEKLKKLLHL